MILFLIGFSLFMSGVAVMPHPHLYGGNEVLSEILYYSGLVLMFISYMRYKNWL